MAHIYGSTSNDRDPELGTAVASFDLEHDPQVTHLRGLKSRSSGCNIYNRTCAAITLLFIIIMTGAILAIVFLVILKKGGNTPNAGITNPNDINGGGLTGNGTFSSSSSSSSSGPFIDFPSSTGINGGGGDIPPTNGPTEFPPATEAPTTLAPVTDAPTAVPTVPVTEAPVTDAPTNVPTNGPTDTPTDAPTTSPTDVPTGSPTNITAPTNDPTVTTAPTPTSTSPPTDTPTTTAPTPTVTVAPTDGTTTTSTPTTSTPTTGSTTTEAPTTSSPTTATTIAPTTDAPTTQSPTTTAPTPTPTPTPTTVAPTTQSPTTAAPTTTEAPTTAAPTTAAPTTAAPTTQSPTTPAPTTAVPTTQSPTTAIPTGTPAPYVPTAPMANDRCTQAFPQSTINTWVSTATCDQCTTAGCGWCTIPVKQSDGSTRFYTSCREKNAGGTADAAGVCIENTIPTASKAFPAGKSTVFANAPSASTTGLTCRAAELAEHPSTPAYPPSTDTCHTLLNARSCSACVDYTNGAYRTTNTSTCGWLTLPITIDGVTRWYTSCRNATLAQTTTARNTPVNLLTLPANKPKTWAQDPIGAKLPNTIGSCRESALADAPYTPAPYLAAANDVCLSKTTCSSCGATAGCGWCSIPAIATNGSVTVTTSCRAGTPSGSSDGACTVIDPRVPATWWGYNITRTWNTTSTCPATITQSRIVDDYLDNTGAWATMSNYVVRANLTSCTDVKTCSTCLQMFHCGWCSSGANTGGRCVSAYRTYGSTDIWPAKLFGGTDVPFSPMCAAPNTHFAWTDCPV